MPGINDVPSQVHHCIIKAFGTRTLARLGAIGKPGIAEAARALSAERQSTAIAWCGDRLDEFASTVNEFMEAAWDGHRFRPGMAPNENFVSGNCGLQGIRNALQTAASAFPDVDVNLGGMIVTHNDRHRFGQLSFTMRAAMPSVLEGDDVEGMQLAATFYFGRDEAWAWERINHIRIRLITPSLDLSFVVTADLGSRDLAWDRVAPEWNWVPHARADDPIDRRRYFLEQEFVYNMPELVRVCWNDNVAALCASKLAALM